MVRDVQTGEGLIEDFAAIRTRWVEMQERSDSVTVVGVIRVCY